MTSFSWILLVGVLTGGTPAAQPPKAVAPAPSKPAPVSLPEARWKGVPGWLGFAATPPDKKTTYYWSPQLANAQAALFSDAWKSVPTGTPVTLLSTAGARPGTFVDSAERPYGCEENKTTLAGFRADAPLPEGPVWVLPQGSAEGATSLPVKEVPAGSPGVPLPKGKKATSKDLRAFDAGGLGVLLTKTGKLKGQLSVFLNGKQAATLPLEKVQMEGADASAPFNLYDPDEVGVVVPLAAFQLGASGPTVVVLGRRGYEGHTFLVAVRRGDKVELIQDDPEGLYFCAF